MPTQTFSDTLSEQDRALWQQIYDDVLTETGDALMAELAAWGALHKATIRMVAGKSAGGNPIIVGWGMLYTSNQDPDLDDQYFNQRTKTFLDLAGKYLWYEHGMDPVYGIEPIGERLEALPFKRGIFTRHEIYATHPQYRRTAREIDDGELTLSSDSILRYMREEQDGYLSTWPLMGWSLTKRPAEPGLGPVTFEEFAEAVKAASLHHRPSEPVQTEQSEEPMDKLLKLLAGAFDTEETVEAVSGEIEALATKMAGYGDQPIPEEDQKQMPDMAQLAQVLGLPPEAAPADIAAALQALLATLQGEPPAGDMMSVKTYNYEALGEAYKAARALAPALPNPLPKVTRQNGHQPGQKSSRNGAPYQHRNLKAPGIAQLVKAITGSGEESDRKTAREIKAMGYSTGPGGGYLLRQEVAPELIELFRAATVIDKLGATYVPMDGIETLTYRKQLTGATATYRGEQQNANQSQPTFGIVQLQLKELVGATRVNRRLLRNSVENLEALLRRDLELALSLRADKAALYGTGGIPNETGATGAEPRGIYYTTGVTSTALATNGAVPEIDDFIDAWGRIEDANVPVSDSWGIAFSPRTKRTMENLRDTTGQLISDEKWSGGHDYYVTTQILNTNTVGSSSDCSDVFLGAWEYLIYGVGQDVEIIVDESVYRLSGEVYIEAAMMHDVGVAQPDAFEVLTGVRA